MTKEYYNKALPSYDGTPPYQIPVPEEHHWKHQYMRIDFENKSFNLIRKRMLMLDVPVEIVEDLIEELMILVNNAGKLNIQAYTIPHFMDIFELYWDSYCIYVLKNHRWIDEINHVRDYVMLILEQELYKSIDGWQGDNILTTRVEQKQNYALRQENVVESQKRGWFRNKKTQNKISPVAQGFNLSSRQE
jgi:hypothetical protein